MREGRPPGYDGRCRDLTPEQRARVRRRGPAALDPVPHARRGPQHVRRRRSAARSSVEWSTISDFVIVRSNGTPVFFLANAVDDLDMEITHVLRGEDLIDSTHRVLALRRALGHDDQPVYAHLPLILGPGGGKLSKRHGAVSVEEYRDAGLPAGRARQLPRAARLGTRRRARGAHASTSSSPSSTSSRVNTVGGDVRPQEARVDERRAHPRAAAAPSSSRRCCRSPATATATGSTSRVFESRGRARAGAGDDARADRRPDGVPLHARRRARDRSDVVGEGDERRTGRARSSTRSIAFVETCEWTDDDRSATRDRGARPRSRAR